MPLAGLVQQARANGSLITTVTSQVDLDGVAAEVAYTTLATDVEIVLCWTQLGFGVERLVGVDTEGHDREGTVKVIQVAWRYKERHFVLIWSIQDGQTGEFMRCEVVESNDDVAQSCRNL